jgi:hypothetical protein
MHNYEFGPAGTSGGPGADGDPYRYGDHGRPGRGMFGTVLMIVAIAIGAMLLLGTAFWAIGLVFHLFGWILKVALLAAVAAFVWRRVTRGRGHRDWV